MENNVTYNPLTICPKCNNEEFELAALKLKNTKYSPWVIKCFHCHTIFGVVPAEELHKHAKDPLN